MSYMDEWYAGQLEANIVTTFVVIDGEKEIDLTSDLSFSNFVVNQGAEDLFNTFSQETVSFELNNAGNKFDDFVFNKKPIRFIVATTGENTTYTTTYKNFYIDNVTRTDEHIQLDCILFNMNQSRLPLSALTLEFTQDFFNIESALYRVASNMQYERPLGYSFGTWSNGSESLSYGVIDKSYQDGIYNNINTNADLIRQLCQLLGGFAQIKRGINYPSMYISHFPHAVLTSEYASYVYGGTFDEVEEVVGELTLQPRGVKSEAIDITNMCSLFVTGEERAENTSLELTVGYGSSNINDAYDNGKSIYLGNYTDPNFKTIKFAYQSYNTTLSIEYYLTPCYSTGDDLDGNTDTKDGGTFSIDYTVINDSVMSSGTVDDYYIPVGVKSLIANWTLTGDEYEAKEVQMVEPSSAPADAVLIDITGAEISKTLLQRTGAPPYRTILSNIKTEACFPSCKFSLTLINNLRFEVGQPVAICTGVKPTQFSYIENINTNIFGSTIISNSRGG